MTNPMPIMGYEQVGLQGLHVFFMKTSVFSSVNTKNSCYSQIFILHSLIFGVQVEYPNEIITHHDIVNLKDEGVPGLVDANGNDYPQTQ